MTLTDYDALLEEVRTKVEAFHRSTANEYIPKMYNALRDEKLPPEDAKDRIQKTALVYGAEEQYWMLYLMRPKIKKSKKQAV
jgi:hypothetical protein